MIFPEFTQRRPRLPEHVRRRRPRLHRRHLPVATSAPLDQQEYALDPQGQGALEVALREPVEPQGRRTSARSRPARRSTASSSATTTRRARTCSTAGSTTSASTASPPTRDARAAVGLGADHPRDQLDRLVLARQQHPGHRGAARLQLLDADDRRRLDELALRLPAGQQRRQPAAAPGVRRLARAEPVDGRPPDVPGHAVAGDRRARRRPRRSRARVPPRQRDRQAVPLRRAVRERDAHRDRADRPRRAVPLHVHRRLRQRDLRQRQRRRRGLVDRPGRRARSPAGPTSPAASPTAPTRLFVYGAFDKPVTQSGMLPDGNRPLDRLRQVRHAAPTRS